MSGDAVKRSEALASTPVFGVNVRWWDGPANAVPGVPPGAKNFGDALSPLLVSRMAPPRGAGSGADLLAIGSITHFASPKSVLWGSGVNGKMLARASEMPPTVDVRALRGPWSGRIVSSLGAHDPKVYGDPALLLPLVFPELEGLVGTSDEVLVVPNFNDASAMTLEARALGLPVMAPWEEPYAALRRIASSGLVIGSSLHAVIVADAFGVPARFVASQAEHPLKYRDYLAGTGRAVERVAPSVAAAVEWGGHEEASVDLSALVEAFPHDLWSGGQEEPQLECADSPVGLSWLSEVEWRPDFCDENFEEIVDAAVKTSLPAARELIELRMWRYPEVVLKSSDGMGRPDSVDRAIGTGDADRVEYELAAKRMSPTAFLEGARDGRDALVLELSVSAPENWTEGVRITLIGTGDGQELRQDVRIFPSMLECHVLDLSVVVGRKWFDVDPSGLSLEIAAGAQSIVLPVEHRGVSPLQAGLRDLACAEARSSVGLSPQVMTREAAPVGGDLS